MLISPDSPGGLVFWSVGTDFDNNTNKKQTRTQHLNTSYSLTIVLAAYLFQRKCLIFY